MTMDLATLDATIEAAFLDVERDEDCTLHQAQLIDDAIRREIPHAELQAAKDKDPETDWRRVPATYLDECDAALSHATPQSWRFYVPAYMRRALHLLDATILETELPGSVIFHLTYSDEYPGDCSYHLERFKLLNAAQGQAVRLFLEYIRDYPAEQSYNQQDAKLALRKYWELDERKRPQGTKLILS